MSDEFAKLICPLTWSDFYEEQVPEDHWIKDDNCDNEGQVCELFETGSVTIEVNGKQYVVSLHVEEVV